VKRGPIVSAISDYVRNMAIDTSLAPFEGVAYKGALHRQGADVQHICAAVEADYRVMTVRIITLSKEDRPTQEASAKTPATAEIHV
jgi:hypothetical protein